MPQIWKDLADEIIAEKIRELGANNDPEGSHANADDVLCGLLRELGYPETVKAFHELKKWYA